MAKLRLTLALSHYDRHIPFFDGSVQADGVDLQVLEVGQSNPLKHGQDRHERMLQKGEFDICELSLSSYLIAKSRGMPFTAIPVFPRRLFSLSQMWVNNNAGIKSPEDLIGKKVGLSTFQTTLSVLAKGDLQAEYGVPWRKLDWYMSKDEAVPIKPLDGVGMQILKPGQKIGVMLEKGEIDALMVPHPPKEALRGGGNIRRLFTDPKAEEMTYFRKNGYYPIMHVVAFKDPVLAQNPWLARSVMEAFDKAKEACVEYYDDPNWSRFVWGRHLFEEERTVFGEDPWPHGVKKNRANLERFIGYSLDQGLMEKKLEVGELFVPSTLDT
ncbi:MAG: ABC transporter substrate-binding protein [Deltaproteobacteria bacterium]|nr:ABC transporter substrate-binding protein [Deltaproteobacteria bacterium]MBI2365883.1 ABC transporter substrate-binding protein [Deltaproteobacteria bacterium]MBI2533201.1 ABC transporter substrate-binding protein [Deltaproteobacteria bacterium]